jgi:hypothetical protein
MCPYCTLPATRESFLKVCPRNGQPFIVSIGMASRREIWMKWSKLILLICLFASNPCYADNSLAVGAAAGVTHPFDVQLNGPVEFNFKSKAEVLAKRTAQVNKYAFLLASPYKPSDQVFGQLTDGRPWWGTLGLGYYGNGKDSIRGPAVHSLFMLNPYILAGVITRYCMFGRAPEAEATVHKLYCEPKSLRIFARESTSQVVYRFSKVLEDFKAFENRESPYSFDIQAYNARDMGYAYIFIPSSGLKNVTADQPASEPFPNPQYFHTGGSCGYPGGCNNQSPGCDALNFHVQQLPARLEVWLYRGPANKSQRPDFTCFIDLI